MLGSHLVKHFSTTQPTISLSSGEAELHGLAKAASQAIGVRSLLADLDFQVQIELYTDAIAAVGIARRRGVGKIHSGQTEAAQSIESIHKNPRQARESMRG